MRKNLNVIEIRGIRGLIMAGFIACCLFAGFVVFPGFVAMHIWNYLSNMASIQSIGLIQGILLWGIIALIYFVIRKNSFVVCVKTPIGLNEDELKAVFNDIKKQSESDPILKAMLKAREAELKSKTLEGNLSEENQETVSASDSHNT